MPPTGDDQVVPAEGKLLQLYAALSKHFGPQQWWPAQTRLEMILGAILTQNTTWHNAALALKRLRQAGCLGWDGLRQASRGVIEKCIRPAGFYRQKSRTIREFVLWLERVHGGSLRKLLSLPAPELRRQLLELRGWGPETVDAVLLYAGRHPYFVADTYTRRILSRHGLLPAQSSYAQAQEYLHRSLPPDHTLFNEFHALLVETGKHYCQREAPLCEACPLKPYLPADSPWRNAQTVPAQPPAVQTVDVEGV